MPEHCSVVCGSGVMKETKTYGGRQYSVDTRRFDFEEDEEGRLRVYVDGKWWMPRRPFPLGFDQPSATFDSYDNAVSAVSEQFSAATFFEFDDDDRIIGRWTSAQYARHLAQKG
jgi:hypothetical protein